MGCLRLLQDHPRVCGEKHFGGIIRVCIVGSPPRVRGKGFRNLVEVRLIRITPAYAGKSVAIASYSLACWDHPRVCGEKSTTLPGGGRARGSPPRMRGKVRHDRNDLAGFGITPAYAGKRLTKPFRFCKARGSPPRMRGKASSITGYFGVVRITPAYAGKRKWSCHTTRTHGDHPRVCGEKVRN